MIGTVIRNSFVMRKCLVKRCVATIDYKNMTAMEIEKELFKMKREMGVHFANGAYSKALMIAIQMEQNVAEIMGTENCVHASCLNNVGLMQKNLGHTDDAMNSYKRALAIYDQVEGKKHPSYLHTLSNIAILNKTMAENNPDSEVAQELLESAEDDLTFVIEKKIEHEGYNNKELYVSMNHLASVIALRESLIPAELKLRETLALCREHRGERDIMTALTLNNLGLNLKKQGLYEEAIIHYKEALDIRIAESGPRHHETVVTTHNLAEAYIANGDEDKGKALQNDILAIMDEKQAKPAWSESNIYESIPEHLKGRIPDSDEKR